MSKPSWIKQFSESSYQLFQNHDPQSHLPFDAWGLYPLYSDLWLEKLHKMVNLFYEKSLKIEENLQSFPNLSSCRFQVLLNMIHYQTSGIDKPKIITTIEDFFVESVKLRAKEDLFALSKNIELDEKEVRELLINNKLQQVTLDESKELGKIFVALASLTHGLYNDWCTDYNYEITGPYEVNNEMVLIRSFPDLAPKKLWPEIDWDFKNIRIITKYKNIKAKIAFVGCHIIYSDNTINNLTGYKFFVDGHEINGFKNLKLYRDKLMEIASRQFEKYLSMDFENQKIKFVNQEHYQYKKLFELVKMDWRPSPEILQRIEDKPLIKDVFPSYNMTLESYKEKFGVNNMINAYSKV